MPPPGKYRMESLWSKIGWLIPETLTTFPITNPDRHDVEENARNDEGNGNIEDAAPRKADLQPELEARSQIFWQFFHHRFFDLVGRISCAEVHRDDFVVLKLVRALQKIVQMHMSEFVNLFSPVVRTEKRQFNNQNPRCENCRIIVDPGR